MPRLDHLSRNEARQPNRNYALDRDMSKCKGVNIQYEIQCLAGVCVCVRREMKTVHMFVCETENLVLLVLLRIGLFTK